MNRMRRNWTAKEDALLRDLVQKELDNARPLLWRELAKHIPGRSNKDCRKRWWNSLAGGTVKGAWSAEEDKRLIEAVEKHGTNWTQVAAAVGSRCGDQCSSHWRQALNPDINYCDWTTEEDEQLLHAVRIHGTNWSTIASFHTPQRTTLALKNRYSKLRSRKDNQRKASSATSSSSPPVKAGERKKTAKSTRSSGDDESDDESDNDECDEEGNSRHDDSEIEEQEEDREAHGNDQSARWLDDWASQAAPHRQPNTPRTPPMWSGCHKAPSSKIAPRNPTLRVSGEQWMDGISDQTMAGGHSTSLYPDDGFLSATEFNSGEYAGVAFMGQDDDAMNIDFDALNGALCLGSGILNGGDHLSGDLESPVITPFPAMDTAPSVSGSKDLDQMVVGPAPREKTAETVSHRVSINLSCTTGQLSDVMTLLANTGLPVNVKIDRH